MFSNKNYGTLAMTQIDQLSDQVVYVEQFKRQGGEIDDTARVQRAINAAAGKALVFNPKTYQISASLNLPSDVNICGYGSLTKIVYVPKPTAITGLFYGNGVQNISIRDLQCIGTTNNIVLLLVKTCSNVEVRNCTVSGISVFRSDTFVYSDVTDSLLSKNISISNNSAKGSAGDIPCIEFRYCKNAEADNNKIESYKHGIQWWGGDSNTDKNGAITNTRWAQDISVSNNRVKNVEGGGIWGSMGIHISVVGNIVSECGDVGIDFEGCFNAVATGNNVRNCKNACYAIFFNSLNVEITGNIGSQDGSVGNRLFNTWGTANASEVTLANNSFEFTGAGIGLVDAFSPTARLTVKGNTLKNCNIRMSNNNAGYRDISNNELTFTVVHTNSFNAIEGGKNHNNGVLKIIGNRILTTVTQPTGSRGIYATQDDFNSSPMTYITDNNVKGFQTDIEVNANSANSGIVPRFLVENNKIENRIVRSEGTTLKSAVILKGNLKQDLTPYPAAIPTSGKWDVGQEIKLHPPIAGGKSYAVCVTAGVANNSAWAATKAYAVGAQVNAGGNVYTATVAGTSGSTPPSHTSGTATDGTVTWSFAGQLAVFKNFGAIDA